MEVTIIKLDNYGRGIGYLNNKIVFVENALPKEKVKIEIIKENKKIIEAKVIEYLSFSEKRIKEKCPYSSKCGGCQLNHMSFSDECIFKEEKTKDILYKYAKISKDLIEPIVSHKENYYRNKITLHGNNKILGLYENNSNIIIKIEECMITSPKINQLIKLLQENNKSIQEATIKVSNDDKKSMIKITGEINNLELIKQNVDVLIVNDVLLTTKDRIITNIGKIKYQESITSFFQINNTLTKELYDEAKTIVKEKNPNNVLDLYCGTGTIGIYVSKYCKNIIGIDYNQSNIDDAQINKELNQIQNINFICSKVEDKISDFNDIDLVIVDPPRAGLDEKTRKYLKEWQSLKTIIYISCDLITLSRDLADLSSQFEVKKVKPFNMFPRTYHVESISVLERK